MKLSETQDKNEKRALKWKASYHSKKLVNYGGFRLLAGPSTFLSGKGLSKAPIMVLKDLLLFQCILASLIIVALKGVLLQVKDIVNIWQMSALDGIVWICTYVTVIIVEIDIGLLVGLIVSIVTILFRGLRPYVYRLSRLPNTDIYVERSKYGKVRLVNSCIVIL